MANALNYAVTGLLTVVLFLLVIFLLPKKSKTLAKATRIGLLMFYAAGFAVYLLSNLASAGGNAAGPLFHAQAAFASLYEAGAMFFFENTYGVFAEAYAGSPHFELLRLLFWFVHFGAAAVTITAAMSLFGRELLTRLTLRLNFTRPVTVICGVTAQSIALAADLMKKGRTERVVLIDDNAGPAQIEEAHETGALFLDAPPTDKRMLRLAGINRLDRVCLFAMTGDEVANFRVFGAVLDDMVAHRRKFGGVKLFVQSESDEIRDAADRVFEGLRTRIPGGARPDCRVFNEAELAVRQLFWARPPHLAIPYGAGAREEKTIQFLIVGFGAIGQAALRKSYAECQFAGCTYRAVVADGQPNTWAFFGRAPQFPKACVQFSKCGLQHEDFNALARSHADADYVVVATGDDRQNVETAFALHRLFEEAPGNRNPVIAVHIRNRENVSYLADGEAETHGMVFFGQYNAVFTHDLLVTEQLDDLAKAVNRQYCDANPGYGQKWEDLSAFTRDSNRAAADRIDAVLHVLGKKRVPTGDAAAADASLQALGERINGDADLLDRLAEAEHRRWCAFHIINGWRTWKLDEESIKMRKNPKRKLHIALVDWADLPEVEAQTKEYGYNLLMSDYASIRSIPDVLRAGGGNGRHWLIVDEPLRE